MKLKKTKFLLLLLPLLFSCTSENSFLSTTSSDNENPSSTLEGSSDALSSDETSSELTSSNSETVESSLPEISYVQVFAPTVYSHVYAWVENAGVVDELVGTWPGALLKSYDENWRTYDFQGYTALNIIFNVGSSANQTANLTISSAGYYWYYQ